MIGPILRRAEAGRQPSRREVMLMLQASGQEYSALLDTARRLCQCCKGEEPSLRALITLDDEMQVDAALEQFGTAGRLGCSSVMIRHSGTVANVDQVAGLIRQLTAQAGMEAALALGERSYDAYAVWRQAGASEYVLPHECSNPSLYARLHPGHSPAERLTRYLWLKGLGYKVTGGVCIGLPGQTAEGLADDLEILRNADVSGVVIRPYEPEADTLRLVAIARLCMPEADIWVAADDPMLQTDALGCGANLLVTCVPGEGPDQEAIPIALAQAL